MRILFVAGGTSGVIFGIVPLAQAARNAGHEVFMAAPENVMPTITGAGIPGVPVSSKVMHDALVDRRGIRVPIPEDLHERYIFNGRTFGRYAASCLDGLLALVDRWRPDVVVGGALAFAAPLVAAYAGVPYVKQAIDMGEPRTIDLAAAAELGPELERLGLYDMPRADLFIDICPPSLRPADALPAQLMRYVPYATPKPVEPWMYTRGDRPRLLVSAGSRVTPDSDFDILSGLVEKVGKLDAELLIAAPESVAEKLRPLPDHVRAGWIPLHLVAPTCDLVVHHAGGNTTMGYVSYGVPQVLIPYLPYCVDYSRRLSAYGAARMIDPAEDSAENVLRTCAEMLATPSYRERARALADEVAGLPRPAEAVQAIERLVAGGL
ncbi:MAG TPA: nucleotide disphospho-sugar-binding domain-containing protein [Streptomyces sp.]|uniref:nucleotide disphospho-sugar-binding domain-containing protein n=1 Tax=Streptomyces sp. TaxID=1931 RepID=UPI002D5D49C4|nr:nucleotide disphospho-sugar-binding domain-containing protein [Streptomyces sp.]HZG05469.1 nucleotide disphospho-sugar-binding domain-containing protein [Streptomyces sp.]